MGNIIVDLPAIVQVIGGVYLDNSLFDNEEYFFTLNDFTEEFHKILFGTMYNLHQLGVAEITISTIEDYLSQRPTKFGIYKAYKGAEYLERLKEITQITSFKYYYNRVKKMTLLRALNKELGMDIKWIYDIDNILDVKKRQRQEEWLDNATLDDILNLVNKKIDKIKVENSDLNSESTVEIGKGIEELLAGLEASPDVGLPLFGDLVNTVHRGARLKKFYLRSAATNVGKTRTMIADTCVLGAAQYYDTNKNEWKKGMKQPTLFIATEQEINEIQLMMLAFIADVEEDHIADNQYIEGERERILQAVQILKESPIYFSELLDFSTEDIENVIKINIRQHDVKYVFFDYLHSSTKILGEIASKAKVKGLREDNVLFMLANKLKNICNQYGVFILTSTQLNAGYTDADIFDQNLLRGGLICALIYLILLTNRG